MVVKFSEATGLMFHHFHDDVHPITQGSIDSSTFRSILELVGLENILPAQEWLLRANKDTLEKTDICVTFDDALLCQYDVAKPVLDELDLTAFWFVYSSVFKGGIEELEIYRLFRTTQFENIDAFYEDFFKLVFSLDPVSYQEAEKQFDPKKYLINSSFYSDSDRWFRYLRDHILGSEKYTLVMNRMIVEHDFSVTEAAKGLWLNDNHLVELADQGHVVGLHSYSHPTMISQLSKAEQRREYGLNQKHLTTLLKQSAIVVSHPCNSYSPDTLDVLRELGVKVGFRADRAEISARSNLELPREDHANLITHLAPVLEM